MWSCVGFPVKITMEIEDFTHLYYFKFSVIKDPPHSSKESLKFQMSYKQTISGMKSLKVVSLLQGAERSDSILKVESL